MPQFLVNSPDLNDLNRAKRKVVKNQKKQFSGYERGQISGTTSGVAELYDKLIEKMTNVKASIFEINTSAELTIVPSVGDRRMTANTKTSAIADRFVAASSSLIRSTADLVNFTNLKLKNNLNVFSPAQIDEINTQFEALQNEYEIIDQNLEYIETARHLEQVATALRDLTNTWSKSFEAWITKVGSLIENYNQGLGSPLAEYAVPTDDVSLTGRGYSCKIGGSDYTPRRYL